VRYACAGPPPGRSRPRQFRRVIGYRDLAKLALAIERELDGHSDSDISTANEEVATDTPFNHHTGTAVVKFHGER
jgi:hypothetical protein